MSDPRFLKPPIDELTHYGVKGMRWGVRKDRGGVSRKTDREASKDAKEFARAKMFYGEGAGNRRKLIKAKVEAKSNKDPNYKKAFDRHLDRQDMSKHSEKARTERKRQDRSDRNKKRAGFLARHFTGEWGTQAAFTALIVSGIGFFTSQKGRDLMSQGFNTARNSDATKAAAKLIQEQLRRR